MSVKQGDKEMKASLFEAMIGLTDSLLSELKTALVHGTKEEKKAILNKLKFVRHLMQSRYEVMKAKLNLSDEALSLIANDFIANSPNFEVKLSHAKQALDAQKNELSKLVHPNKNKSNSFKTKSKWIRS